MSNQVLILIIMISCSMPTIIASISLENASSSVRYYCGDFIITEDEHLAHFMLIFFLHYYTDSIACFLFLNRSIYNNGDLL